jgi:hypothetical protein
MKKAIALSISILFGIVLGYFSAPVLFIWVAQSSNPEMFIGSMLANYKDSVICECNERPPAQGIKELSRYLSILKDARAQNPGSRMLAQEIGLAYVRRSTLESKIMQNAQADEDVRQGQEELASLAWKDLSSTHLTALVAQLNSDYRPFAPKSKAMATAASNQ